MPLEQFLEDVAAQKPFRVRGTAVFMASNPHGTPPVLLHHFKHNQVLHEQVALLSLSEVVLGPIWVALLVNELPSALTLLGGALVLSAIVAQAVIGMRRAVR